MTEEKLLDMHDMMRIFQASRSSIMRWEKCGKIPGKIHFGETNKSIAWLKSEVDAWIEQKKKARYSCNMKK